jgi:hypothetical protein
VLRRTVKIVKAVLALYLFCISLAGANEGSQFFLAPESQYKREDYYYYLDLQAPSYVYVGWWSIVAILLSVVGAGYVAITFFGTSEKDLLLEEIDQLEKELKFKQLKKNLEN